MQSYAQHIDIYGRHSLCHSSKIDEYVRRCSEG